MLLAPRDEAANRLAERARVAAMLERGHERFLEIDDLNLFWGVLSHHMHDPHVANRLIGVVPGFPRGRRSKL